MTRASVRSIAVSGWLILAATSSAVGGSLNVSPVRIELPPDGRPEVVRLRNQGDSPTYVQVEAVAWSDDGSQENNEPVWEVLAIPPVFELDTQAEQVIRLAKRSPLVGSVEETYRLIITEVPREVDTDGTGLMFAIRLSLPIFVTPPGAAPKPIWVIRHSPDGGPRLVLSNQGQAHLRLQTVELHADSQTEPVFAAEDVSYVLAGKELSWPLELATTQLDGPLTLKAETNIGPLETTVSWPEG